jgi:TRAP transporter TAXI family solute receptor
MRTKKIAALLLAVVMIVALMAACGSGNAGPTASPADAASPSGTAAPASAAPAPAENKNMTFSANPSTSVMYTYWIAAADAISGIYPEYKITVSAGTGGTDSTNRLRNKEVNLANCTWAGDYNDYFGKCIFEGEPNTDIRLCWAYQDTPFLFAVSEESGVTSLSDLAGKKFNPSNTGTDGALVVQRIFELLNVDVNIYAGSAADAVDAYSNRQIAGVTKVGPIGDTQIIQMNTAQPTVLISLTDEEVSRICEDMPYLFPSTNPAGTYDFIDHDVQTITMWQGCKSTPELLSQEDEYKFIKAMHENDSVWKNAYPSGAGYDILQDTIDYATYYLHAGTVQYLQELGYDVPENLIPPEYVKAA